jgi:hypothetical protein
MDEFIVFNHLSPQPSVGVNEMKPTVLELLKSLHNSIARYPNPCVSMSRSSISILESNESDVQAFMPPSLQSDHTGVKGMDFKTLRYPYTIPNVVLPGKALVDLRQASWEQDLQLDNVNCHRPLRNHVRIVPPWGCIIIQVPLSNLPFEVRILVLRFVVRKNMPYSTRLVPKSRSVPMLDGRGCPPWSNKWVPL